MDNRKQQEIEFRREIDARGILSNNKGCKETEMSTLQYLTKNNVNRAVRKIKGHPVMIFSTDTIIHCNTKLTKAYFAGMYYDKETKKTQQENLER